jgi:putative sterol carrier protein
MAIFPKDEWLIALEEKLNSDMDYGRIAKNWEGDMLFVIVPEKENDKSVKFYLDLWHGKCRNASILSESDNKSATFTLSGTYENYVRLLQGKIDPVQALLTRKLSVSGNMGTLMKNVPTVLDFVRCCREITDGFE